MQLTTSTIVAAIVAFSSAAPTQVQERAAAFYPVDVVSTFSYATSTVDFNTTVAQIYADSDPVNEVSTLLTFRLRDDQVGKQCILHFIPQTVEGSGQFDIFSSLFPAVEGATNNQRNEYLGRFEAHTNYDVVPVGNGAVSFPCPTSDPWAIELVPITDGAANGITDDTESGAVGSIISFSFY